MKPKFDLKGSRILFLTAGVGGENFELAAKRLVRQANNFGLFTDSHSVLEAEVLEICPRLLDWFELEELRKTKGFGWYSWKSTLAYEALVNRRWGTFDFVMYLDAGCEMFHSSYSERKLLEYLQCALTNDRTLFAIPTPEHEYTKRDLFDYFPTLNSLDTTPQFQSGSWILKSVSNIDFVTEWEELAKVGIFMTDESPSLQGEHPNFLVHRYDQSIFSLACKKRGYLAHSDTPPGNTQLFRSKVRAFCYPFWWSRNRTGQTMIPGWLLLAGRISLFFNRSS